ncbi:PilZ domain-containing protein [Undibacterium sp. Ji22W]|uniref:PilZ domain-containing protein n=1 Tax=Undibacterium sp. Ji22W TaxID=3413038 RepID=UPI003BF1CE1C
MIELRRSPRINVTWRGLIKLGEGKVFPIRVFNISETGILIMSEQVLTIDKEYQLMLEIPHIDQESMIPYKVPCKVVVSHAILSGNFFRVGVRILEIADLHRDLINAWVSLSKKFDPPKEN